MTTDRMQRKRLRARAKSLLGAQRAMMSGLVELRGKRGLTQQGLAELIGISQSAVAQFERYDANPTLRSVRRYALAVGADLVITVRPIENYEYGNEVQAEALRPNLQKERDSNQAVTDLQWDRKTMSSKEVQGV